MDEEWVAAAIRNFLELWIKPEIDRRLSVGTLSRPYALSSAQIVFFPDGRMPLVRLDDEVKAQGWAKVKPGISKEKGEIVFEEDIEEIVQIMLPPDSDRDCGHATILRFRDRWLLSFDFVYNKALSSSLLQSSEDFLATAVDALSKDRIAPFLDNLFNSAELAARSLLLSVPDPKFREKGSHFVIHSRINLEAKRGAIDPDLAKAFNSLYENRVGARYQPQPKSIDPAQTRYLLESTERLIALAKQRIARPEPGGAES